MRSKIDECMMGVEGTYGLAFCRVGRLSSEFQRLGTEHFVGGHCLTFLSPWYAISYPIDTHFTAMKPVPDSLVIRVPIHPSDGHCDVYEYVTYNRYAGENGGQLQPGHKSGHIAACPTSFRVLWGKSPCIRNPPEQDRRISRGSVRGHRGVLSIANQATTATPPTCKAD
jgi:hypothetical protein